MLFNRFEHFRHSMISSKIKLIGTNQRAWPFNNLVSTSRSPQHYFILLILF